MSAACPIWRGYLSDVDCRWNVLCQANDDRTIEEKQRSTLSSRFSSAPAYLCEEHNCYNDVEFDIDAQISSLLVARGWFFLIEKKKQTKNIYH